MPVSPVVDLSNSFGAGFIGFLVCLVSVLSSTSHHYLSLELFIVSSGWHLRKREL